MTPDMLALALGLLLLLTAVNLVLLLRRNDAGAAQARRDEGEAMRQGLAVVQRAIEVSQRVEAEAMRAGVLSTERQLMARLEDQRVLMEVKLREMSDQAGARLAEIQKSVDEKLAESVEKSMQGSFQRVIDQFAQVQKAMGDVQAVTAQIGDLKRIFTNVKTRGAWGEMALRALLEDMLPHGGWEANRKLRLDSNEAVEFVLLMPSREMPRPLLAIDAKFPAEDYDRLLLASEAGEAEIEREARAALLRRIVLEAKKIASKYIVQPTTVDFAIMYLPTDGLYVEAARAPGLIETLNKEHRVLVMGPTLLPALIRTIQLGALTLTIEQKAGEINRTLGAVRTEFGRIDGVLDKLQKQAGTVSNTIADARTRTKQMAKVLRHIEAVAADEVEAVLALEALVEDEPA